ncbi:MAG: hypothetical protein ABIH26_03420 [Candidatus Eisenbacteria bacterium]
MTILLGIAVYFALAVFVGRFLSLSTRGTVAYLAPSAPLHGPAQDRSPSPKKAGAREVRPEKKAENVEQETLR